MAAMRTHWPDDRIDDLKEQVDSGFAQVDKRFEHVDQRFNRVDERIDALKSEVQDQGTELRGKIEEQGKELRVAIEKQGAVVNNRFATSERRFAGIVLVDHDLFKSIPLEERCDKIVYDTRGLWLDQPGGSNGNRLHRAA